ncbi:MAG: caspase family protein [Magnetococcus sp. DMHC-1]
MAKNAGRCVLDLLLVLVFGLGCLVDAMAVENPPPPPGPPKTPFLRIETGMHTAMINRLAVDGKGNFVATVSDDKTVRVWSLPEGKLLATLRVPIGSGNEGSLYSVAISPDGKSLLTAGATGHTWDGLFSLYLLDLEKERIKGVLPNLKAPVFHMAYAPDGKKLALAESTYGLVLLDGSGKGISDDRTYEGAVHWVAFSHNSELLATTSLDGHVRLYDGQGKLLGKRRFHPKDRPLAVAFSPDDTQLAVGSMDSPRVEIMSASDLKAVHIPDVGGMRDGNTSAVAWSQQSDGLTLVAGGTAVDAQGNRLVRYWSQGGRGKYRDVPIKGDAITQLTSVPAGILYASATPAWGLIPPNGERLEKKSVANDFRGIYQGRLSVADDGLGVEFGTRSKGTHPFRLDLLNETLTPVSTPDKTFATPITQTPQLAITGWEATNKPMLGKKPLELEGEEISRSLTILNNQKGFLLGSDFYLRLFDAQGNVLKKINVPAPVAGLVATRNNALAVAALLDGTLHWYSLNENSRLDELATFFMNSANARWVAWTPEGFFAHAYNGGQEMVGYHYNKGKSKSPLWVDFDQLYRKLHRPDLLNKKIMGQAAQEIQLAQAAIGDMDSLVTEKLPTVEPVAYCYTPKEGGGEKCQDIVTNMVTRGLSRTPATVPPAPAPGAAAPSAAPAAPAATATSATKATGTSPQSAIAIALPEGIRDIRVRYQLSGKGNQEIGNAALILNSRNIEQDDKVATRGLSRAPDAAQAGKDPALVIEKKVTLDPGKNTLVLRVYDKSKAFFSTSRQVDFVTAAAMTSRGSAIQKSEKPAEKPRLFVLAAGVNLYKSVNILRYAVADAKGFVDAVQKRKGALFGNVLTPKLLPDGTIKFVGYSDQAPNILADEEVTKDNLNKAFSVLANEVRKEDTVLIYLAGHGVNYPDENKNDQYYYITQNVAGPEPEIVSKQGFGGLELVERLVKVNKTTGRILLILDTCHAGAVALDRVMENIQHEIGMTLLAASSSAQEALDGYRKNGRDSGHGVFAYAILDGINGNAAASGGDAIDNIMLGQYVKRMVPRLVQETNPNHKQKPSFKTPGGELEEFPVSAKQ